MLHPRIKQASLLLLSLAALLRIIVFFQNRTLFLDEANLSRNVVEKSYGALFGVLDYEQFAPPMYSVVVKFVVQLFGVNEYSLRLFSLLMGFGALYLFYRLALKMFSNVGILYAVALLGFSIFMMRYQTENKQYAGDVFFLLLFLFSVWHFEIKTLKQYGLLGLAGAIGLWFSMPLVFTLAAIGLYLFYENWVVGNNEKPRSYAAAGLALTGFMWLGSFAVLFFVNLKAGLDSTYLQDFHQHHYLKFPTSLENIRYTRYVWRGFLSSMVGTFYPVVIWTEICIVLGVYHLYKKEKGKVILLTIPIVAALVASMLGKFVLLPRVCLFMMPLYFLLIGLGAEFLYGKAMLWNNKLKYGLVVLMLALACWSIGSKTGIPYFVKEYEIATSRSILQRISEHPENKLPIYVIHIAKPTYRFYTQLYDSKIVIPSASIIYGDWSDDLPTLATEWKQQGIDKIWIYDSHTFGKKLAQLKTDIANIGETEVLIDGTYGNGYLVRLK